MRASDSYAPISKSKGTTNNVTKLMLQVRLEEIRKIRDDFIASGADSREGPVVGYAIMYLKHMIENWTHVKTHLNEPNGLEYSEDRSKTWGKIIKELFGENAKVRSPAKTKGHAGGSRKKRGTRRHRR